MADIRKFAETDKRVETGPIQFGEDWPGIFIRGDNAFAFIMDIKAALEGNRMARGRLRTWARYLGECNLNREGAARLQAQIESIPEPLGD
jgi:hypothetical protein